MKPVKTGLILLLVLVTVGSVVNPVMAASQFSKYYNVDLDDTSNDAYVYLHKLDNSLKVEMWTEAELTGWEFLGYREEVSAEIYVLEGGMWKYLTSLQSIANLLDWYDYDSKSGTYFVSSGTFKIKVCEGEYIQDPPDKTNNSTQPDSIQPRSWVEYCGEDIVYLD
jgi:hypothetical protein